MATAEIEAMSTASDQSAAIRQSVKSFLSGGIGGIALVLVGHPFDLIKVRLQTAGPGVYKGLLDCALRTVRRDGFRGLYRGMLTPLIGVAPIFAVCFWGYDLGLQLSQLASRSEGHPPSQYSLSQICFAGGFSAVPTTLLMTPTERIKVLLQVQGINADKGVAPKYSGPSDALRQVWREGGIRALYRGTAATLVRDVPGSVAYFGVYEVAKKFFIEQYQSITGSSSYSPIPVLTAGGLAGIANWTVSIPADVVKSRLQTAPPGQYRNATHVVTDLVKKEGWGALFKGLGPAMVRAFPANAACFFGVDIANKYLLNWI